MGVIGPLIVGLPIALEAMARLNQGASSVEGLAGAGGSIGGGLLGAGLGGTMGLASKHRKWLSPLLAAGGSFGGASLGGSAGGSVAGLFRGDPEFEKLRRVAALEQEMAQRNQLVAAQTEDWLRARQGPRDIATIFAQNAFAPRPPVARTPSQIPQLAAAALQMLG